MKHRASIPLLIVFVLASLLAGCSKKDKTIEVEANDPEMVAAIAKSRDSLPQFWNVFQNREHGETDFCLKVKITDNNGVEHFWVINIERKDGKILGTINNDPNTVRTVKLGDRVTIPDADISDWLYMRDGKMVGNYTIRVLFKQMPAAEVANFKKMLADP